MTLASESVTMYVNCLTNVSACALMQQRVWQLLPVAMLALAAVLVVTLATQKRALEIQLDDQHRLLQRPFSGFVVPAFNGVTLTGDSVAIGAMQSGERQVLFTFNSTCGFCRRSLPAWKGIHETLATVSSASVYGISLDPEAQTLEYVRRHQLPFPVVLLSDPRIVKLYRAEVVPITAVVNSAGILEYVRIGSLEESPEAVDSIIRMAAQHSMR